MNTPRNITGFFSRAWSSLTHVWTQIHRPRTESLSLLKPETLDPAKQAGLDQVQMKMPALLWGLKITWLVTLVQLQQAAFLNTWLKQSLVTASKIFLMHRLHLMVSVRFAVNPVIMFSIFKRMRPESYFFFWDLTMFNCVCCCRTMIIIQVFKLKLKFNPLNLAIRVFFPKMATVQFLYLVLLSWKNLEALDNHLIVKNCWKISSLFCFLHFFTN